MTAMHHEPVADRLGVPTHQLPADWRQRGGGGGGGMGGGGQPPRSGCALFLLTLPVALVLAAYDRLTGTDPAPLPPLPPLPGPDQDHDLTHPRSTR